MKSAVLFALCLALFVTACSSKDNDSSSAKSGSDTNPAEATTERSLKEWVVAEKPDGSKPLREVKSNASVGDVVTFDARVGGRAKPFVDGRAVMVVIDPGLPSCADNPGDSCPIPWDYCCETKETLIANTATVQIVKDDGSPLASSIKSAGIAELDHVTVVGRVVDADESGLFVVNATALYLP